MTVELGGWPCIKSWPGRNKIQLYTSPNYGIASPNVLVASHHHRFADSFEAYGVHVTHVRADAPGSSPSLDQISAALDAAPQPFKAITITHVDTSTAVLMDVKAVAALVREEGMGGRGQHW